MIGSRQRPETWLTTGGQAAIWFADQRLGPTAAYNTTVALEVEGAEESQLQRAYQRLVECTPALRIRMGLNDQGNVVQWLAEPTSGIEWIGTPIVNTGGPDLDPAIRESVVRPFHTDGGQLCRMTAGNTTRGTVLAVLVAHHLVNDGTSQVEIARRFVRCLTGEIEGESPIGYFGLVERVRRSEAKAKADDLEYWVRRLESKELGASRLGGDDSEPYASYQHCRFSPSELAKVNALARRAGVSTFMILLGAVHYSLAHAGVAPSVVANAVSVRPRDSTSKNVPGCFINQIPMVADCRMGESFIAFVQRENRRWQSDLSRRCLPLIDLVDDPRLRKMANQFDGVGLSVRRVPEKLFWERAGYLVTADLGKRYFQPKSPLSVRFIESGKEATCDFEWNTTLPASVRSQITDSLIATVGGHMS